MEKFPKFALPAARELREFVPKTNFGSKEGVAGSQSTEDHLNEAVKEAISEARNALLLKGAPWALIAASGVTGRNIQVPRVPSWRTTPLRSQDSGRYQSHDQTPL
ncbi:hypothetical protein E4U37_003592 [Claviceps purpurea]|nr:hypothetical protein E4U37_003592 [Claviceps purpurea]